MSWPQRGGTPVRAVGGRRRWPGELPDALDGLASYLSGYLQRTGLGIDGRAASNDPAVTDYPPGALSVVQGNCVPAFHLPAVRVTPLDEPAAELGLTEQCLSAADCQTFADRPVPAAIGDDPERGAWVREAEQLLQALPVMVTVDLNP